VASDRVPDGAEVHELVLGGERYLVLSHSITSADQLTPAEHEVLALLDRGWSDGEIVAERTTSRGTVTKQIDAIFRKLGVGSRRELLARRR
jgi:DNA-binding NarL/FixJ family response regulator